MGLSRKRLHQGVILGLIDRREIRWAWDIARRPEVRIWRESLLAYLAREGGGPNDGGAEDLTLEQVIGAVLPKPAAITPRAATVGRRELQRRFLCSRNHVAHLIADGELSCLGASGPGETPAVLYQSAFEFLKRRTMSV